MSQQPRPHPEPPADFESLDLPLSRRARRWFRTYRCRREPVFFGTSRSSRFDDPNGKFGVLYLATELEGAFVEGCLVDSGLDTTGPLLGERFHRDPVISQSDPWFTGRWFADPSPMAGTVLTR